LKRVLKGSVYTLNISIKITVLSEIQKLQEIIVWFLDSTKWPCIQLLYKLTFFSFGCSLQLLYLMNMTGFLNLGPWLRGIFSPFHIFCNQTSSQVVFANLIIEIGQKRCVLLNHQVQVKWEVVFSKIKQLKLIMQEGDFYENLKFAFNLFRTIYIIRFPCVSQIL